MFALFVWYTRWSACGHILSCASHASGEQGLAHHQALDDAHLKLEMLRALPAAKHMELVGAKGSAVLIGVGASAAVRGVGAGAPVMEPKRSVQRGPHDQLHLF